MGPSVSEGMEFWDRKEQRMYKLLVVEDDEVIARAIKSHMEGWGYQVACAGILRTCFPLLWRKSPSWY